MNISKWLVLFTLFFSIQITHAAGEPTTQLKNFLTLSKTLAADFKQVVFDEMGAVKQTSYGVFHLSRPNKFRWSYQKPFVQEIISNAGKVWFYDADLEQVTVKSMDTSMGATPALLLSGKLNIDKEFILQQQGIKDGLNWIKLLPKNKDSSFKYILIGLKNGMLGGMELSDHFGQLTRIYFSNFKLNPSFNSNEFVFNLPKGVDVFEG